LDTTAELLTVKLTIIRFVNDMASQAKGVRHERKPDAPAQEALADPTPSFKRSISPVPQSHRNQCRAFFARAF